MNNLSASKWASRHWRGQPSASVLFQDATHTAAGQLRDIELSKHKKLLARLKWKSALLLVSHQRVTQAMQPSPQETDSHSQGANEAETMFKLDFFEYYVLLERVLLHLLGVFDISISPHLANGPAEQNDPTATKDVLKNGAPIIGSSNYDRSFTHRFHANVLQALDRPSNPLHTALGTGEVRYYLGIAKESRNRWKDAEEDQLHGDAVPDPNVLKHQRMLKNVDLEVMLSCILEALDKAQGIAEEHARTHGQKGNVVNASSEAGIAMEYDMEDAPLEMMPDAMEWEEF